MDRPERSLASPSKNAKLGTPSGLKTSGAKFFNSSWAGIKKSDLDNFHDPSLKIPFLLSSLPTKSTDRVDHSNS
jgi:hypothetical protein